MACLAVFHHVKVQLATLRDLARVLRPWGRIAMVEPGPHHSQTAQSLAEMAQFKVIENDIVMADIAAAAQQGGLIVPQILVQLQRPWVVPFNRDQQWADSPALPESDAARLVAKLHRQLTDQQCFYLQKPGHASSVDSRRSHALAAKLQLQSASPAAGATGLADFRFRICNTGEATWLCRAGIPGQVNLGCQLLGPDDSVVQLDFARFPLESPYVAPGSAVKIAVRVKRPEVAGEYYWFDLVAEQIATFQQSGHCQPVDWHPGA